MAETLPEHERDDTAIAAALARKVEGVFERIERERMRDIPILNPELKVATTGMRSFGDVWVTVLVTPWSINAMLFPNGAQCADSWTGLPIGTKVQHSLPAGVFEFICGGEDGLGPYRMCSLFSPVLQFENQEAALAAANAALGALFDENLGDPPAEVEAPQVSRRNLIFGRNSASEERA
jgi:[NiFe] hydrogenase assembly HybE family chaperone